MKNKEKIFKEIEEMQKNVNDYSENTYWGKEYRNQMNVLKATLKGYELCEKEKDEEFRKFVEELKEIVNILDENCSREDAEGRGMEKEWDVVFNLKQKLTSKYIAKNDDITADTEIHEVKGK